MDVAAIRQMESSSSSEEEDNKKDEDYTLDNPEEKSEEDVGEFEDEGEVPSELNVHDDYNADELQHMTSMKFRHRCDLEKYVRDYYEEKGVILKIGKHSDRSRIMMKCLAGNKFHRRSTGKRDTSTRLCDCPFEIKGAYYLKIDSCKITKVYEVHNHPISNAFYKYRKFSEEETKLIRSSVKQRLCLMWRQQLQNLTTHIQQNRILVKPQYRDCVRFAEIVGYVSTFALDKLYKHLTDNRKEEENDECTGTFKSIWGLPCRHDVNRLESVCIPISLIHDQWRLDVETNFCTFINDDANEDTNVATTDTNKETIEETTNNYSNEATTTTVTNKETTNNYSNEATTTNTNDTADDTTNTNTYDTTNDTTNTNTTNANTNDTTTNNTNTSNTITNNTTNNKTTNDTTNTNTTNTNNNDTTTSNTTTLRRSPRKRNTDTNNTNTNTNDINNTNINEPTDNQ